VLGGPRSEQLKYLMYASGCLLAISLGTLMPLELVKAPPGTLDEFVQRRFPLRTPPSARPVNGFIPPPAEVWV